VKIDPPFPHASDFAVICVSCPAAACGSSAAGLGGVPRTITAIEPFSKPAKSFQARSSFSIP
jgi:hypothetical protein